jgi:peptide/nickel transport system substrate-binding protein
VDDHTIRITTTQPAPLLPNEMTVLYIYARSVPVEQFNTGEAAIGTGPYRLREWVKGSQIVLERNPSHWGKPPDWERVTFRVIGAGPTRIASLLNNEVDMINDVPPADISRLKTNPEVNVILRSGERIMMLTLDSSRDVSPFVTDTDGKALFPNPLRDWRVRKAITKAINRDALVDRLMDGVAVAAGQIASPGMFGHDPNLKPEPFDPDGAKKLLAEAGYPNGFGLTVHGSSNRFPNDSQLTQALGQMFSRGGLKVNGVEVLPYNVYAPGATARKYSLFIFSYGSVASSSLNGLSGVLASFDKEAGTGSLNRARYSNPQFDALLKQAAAEFDEGKRNKLLADATRVAMEDAGILPLYWQKLYWAARKGYVVDPDRGESTSVRFVSVAR